MDVGEITVRRALVALCDDGLLERRRGHTAARWSRSIRRRARSARSAATAPTPTRCAG
nr:hypothetical protein [Streptomyces sp. SID8377]